MNLEKIILKTFLGTPVNDYPGRGKTEKDVVFFKLPDWDLPVENFEKLKKASRMSKPVNFAPVGAEKEAEVNECN